MLNAAYNLFLPEVAIDGHEKFSSVRSTGESICTDMELQVGAGSLNHPAAMTELAMKIALKALEKSKDLGLRGHFYAKLASAAGGAAGRGGPPLCAGPLQCAAASDGGIPRCPF